MLGELDAALARTPADVPLLFARGSILTELGRYEEAERAYRAVLEQDRNHLAALTKLGLLVRSSGDWIEARALLELAAASHPDSAAAHVNLANLLAVADPAESQRRYEAALSLQPDLAEAHQGLSALLSLLGDEEKAQHHRAVGFAGRELRTRRYTGTGTPIPVILLTATTGGNLDASVILDESRFLVHEVFADVWDPATKLPAHEFVVNGIADADRSAEALRRAEELLQQTASAVLNPPHAVRSTSRAAVAERFAGTEGMRVPKIELLSRAGLAGEDALRLLNQRGFVFPLLLRAPGHHVGRHFHKVEDPAQLAAAVATLPGDAVYAIEYLDTRSGDKSFRKYRVMIVGGELYPVHLAVATQWKVHYFSSDMAHSELYRREEARFLEDMPGAIGARATSALRTIARELGLDYAGVDFALAPDGSLVLFETNAAMSIYRGPKNETWSYRIEPTQRVVDAVRRMVLGYCTPAT